MKIKKLLQFLFLILSSVIVINAIAAETIAKEDTTPPPPEGALTENQIPPIESIKSAPPTNPVTAPKPKPSANMDYNSIPDPLMQN